MVKKITADDRDENVCICKCRVFLVCNTMQRNAINKYELKFTCIDGDQDKNAECTIVIIGADKDTLTQINLW